MPLINPTTLIYDREHFEKGLVNHFLFREIAFDTEEKFIWKLNAYVAERANSYNKMFTSQLIEIDPFVTDYMVIESQGKTSVDEHKRDTKQEFNKRDSVYTSDTSSDSTENYSDTDENKHYKENSGVELKAKLNSESENKNSRSEKATSLTHDETETEGIKTTKNYTKDNTTEETINKTIKGSEDINVTGRTTSDTDKNINTTNDTTFNHNQTGRQWTENGSSSRHNLDVHSDTPQAMLFNTPPHYTGTGRSGVEGQTEQLNHYAETSPTGFDSNSYTFNSGDAPWFNYASDANNQVGHDSYSKNGTETFTQTDTTANKGSQTEGESVEGHSTNDTDRDYTETQNTTDKTIAKETYAENTSSDRNRTDKYSDVGSEEAGASDSRSLNANEHVKGDSKAQENYKEEGASSYNQTNVNIGKRADNTSSKNDTASNRTQKNNQDTETNNNSVRKGRTMRSPSQLLAEYRETMTFNADLWIYGELEPLFMQLY